MAAWFLAASPIKRSSAEKATYEGVVRFPSTGAIYEYIFTSWSQIDERSLAMISTRSFCHTPTQLWGRKKQVGTGRKVNFRYIRVGGTEINANSTVKEILGHFFFVVGREMRKVVG
jgi:hypothetical protein